ncbi:MAG TPA: peptide deformylase, partial [Steroidobacteraceae bacterium]|nr:peptide deformylase [Steroidobacteraceae bacterium]
MTKLAILEYPDPRLRNKAEPIASVDDAVRRMVDDMLETMYAAKGVGLAATQVDVHKRLLVLDASDERNQPLVLINPEILAADGRAPVEEGCLSV